MNQLIDRTSRPGRVHPSAVADTLTLSIEKDLLPKEFSPESPDDLGTLARWAVQSGYFNAEIRVGNGPDHRLRIQNEERTR